MNSRYSCVESTKAFVRDNLTDIVKEYNEWRSTDRLPDGRFREASRKLDSVTSMGTYGKSSYVTGRLKIVETIMFEYLVNEHLDRAGFFGARI